LGRPALDHVGDENLFPFQPNGGEQFFQKSARWTNEGPALPVFMEAGAFPNKHDFGVLGPLARHGVGTALVQGTVGAGVDEAGYFYQAFHDTSPLPIQAAGLTGWVANSGWSHFCPAGQLLARSGGKSLPLLTWP
jgi:hypothetical protein